MICLLLQFVFLALPVFLPMALYRSRRPFMAAFYRAMTRQCPDSQALHAGARGPAAPFPLCLYDRTSRTVRHGIVCHRMCRHVLLPGERTDGSASCSTVRRHLSPAAVSHWQYVPCRSCSPCPSPSHISFWLPCSIPPAESWPNGRTGTGGFTCRNIRMRCPKSTIAIITRGCHDNADRSSLILSAQ